MMDGNELLAHFGPEARGLDAVHDQRQVGVLGSFNQDAPIAILDLVKLSLLPPPKRFLNEVTDGGQHAADEIRVG